ncbi:MAG: endonuclease domain-containing protein [Myxococcales bacterium]|nr:endonuclease domain-containing protein [Myxococcales bacterium]
MRRRMSYVLAKELRRNETDAEKLLRRFLRNRHVGDAKFRRQQPIGPYVADFACMSLRLVVELDGGHHAEREEEDARRSAYLASRGIDVMRIWNPEVLRNAEGVVEAITERVEERKKFIRNPSP